jgi:hypothetical protein
MSGGSLGAFDEYLQQQRLVIDVGAFTFNE